MRPFGPRCRTRRESCGGVTISDLMVSCLWCFVRYSETVRVSDSDSDS